MHNVLELTKAAGMWGHYFDTETRLSVVRLQCRLAHDILSLRY